MVRIDRELLLKLKNLLWQYGENCDCKGNQYGAWGPCPNCVEARGVHSELSVLLCKEDNKESQPA